MARRRQFKRRYNKRSAKRRKSGSTTKRFKSFRFSPTNPVGFPSSRQTVLRYSDAYVYSPTFAIPSPTGVYRVHSPYDPDASAGGASARGYNNWSQLFQSYLVLKSRITVTPICHFTGSAPMAQSPAAVLSIMLTRNSASPTQIAQLLEQGITKYRVFSPNGTDSTPKPLTMTYDVKSYANIKDPEDNRALYGSVIGGNPSIDVHFVVTYQGLDQVYYPQPIMAMLTIDYLVEWAYPQVI